jgi:hypothetical protein
VSCTAERRARLRECRRRLRGVEAVRDVRQLDESEGATPAPTLEAIVATTRRGGAPPSVAAVLADCRLAFETEPGNHPDYLRIVIR